MHKTPCWSVVGACVILGTGLIAVNSCGKKEPSGPNRPAEGSTQPKVKDPANGLVPIPMTLPKPMFMGTPTNIEGVTNLEEPLGRARDLFLAPKGVSNVALGKTVKSSVPEPIMGQLASITNGNKEATETGLVELDPFVQSITIDLEQNCEIYAILVWHYHLQSRVYSDVVVQVADDPDFITNVHTLFNNDIDNSAGLGVGKDKSYVETHEGKLIDAKGVKARYVRLYSNGNSSNDQNHYLEVEVYGKPVP